MNLIEGSSAGKGQRCPQLLKVHRLAWLRVEDGRILGAEQAWKAETIVFLEPLALENQTSLSNPFDNHMTPGAMN